MEKKCANWYRNFKPPPESKVYYPTDAEFSDPISYVEKIRAEGEKYGVVKVVPPASFRPPYAINERTFRFKTRVQPLYGIDALCRNRIFFVHELKVFWKNAGREFQWSYINDHYIDFVRLRELVLQCGGVDEVNKQRKWADFAQILGFDRSDCVTLKDRYIKWIVPFEEHWLKLDKLAVKSGKQRKRDPLNFKSSGGRMRAETQPSRMSTRTTTRMMAGLQNRKPQQTPAPAPIKLNSCGKCSKAINEDPQVVCSECHQKFHKYCLTRMVNSRPVKDWKCLQCLVHDVHEADFFFSDNDQYQTLQTFHQKADEFKCKHFGVSNIKDVPLTKIEREYWSKVGDFDCTIKVEYGADLLSSEISSGFPRQSDDIRNCADSELRQKYAKHPWNLNNLPVLDRSVLGHVGTEISGMMIPWVYAGMCFSTFCWHVEDHWTYSMNYMHRGETKVWYGFGEQYAEKFDSLIKSTMPALFERAPDLLHHMNTAVNPMFLIDNGIPVHTVRQNAGEFVITFPRAYHSGFNSGFNVAEAVNFAPPDWLSIGRKCIESYTKDQRRCVFAHDELVLRIAQTEQRLDIKTCRAVIAELEELLNREQTFRSALMNAGVRSSEACDFEHLDDDHRSCAICQTTLFITALRCKHEEKGLACSRHWRQLCADCSVDECVIKYRYSLQQLNDFSVRLIKRVEAADEWQQLLNETLESGQKISPSDAKALLDSFHLQNLLECTEQMRLDQELSGFRLLATKAQRVLRPAVRLRDDTRCQRADDRLTLIELDSLIAGLKACLICDNDMLDKLKKRRTQLNEWQTRVSKAINEVRKKAANANTLQTLELLKTEGESFNIRLDEIEILRQITDYSEWKLDATEVIQKFTKARNYALTVAQSPKREFKVGDEDGLFDDESRISHDKLKNLIAKGARLRHYMDEVGDLLESLQQIGHHVGMRHKQITNFFNNKSATNFADVIAFNKSVLDLDWLSSEWLDNFRDAYQLAYDAWSQFMELEQSPDFYFYTLDQVIEKFQKSILLAGTLHHQSALLARKLVSDFTREINSVFLRPLTYFSTFEILAAREDIPSIIEAGPETLYRQTSDRGYEDWTELKRFETEDDMCNHVNQLFNEQRKLLVALRRFNQRASTSETCLKAPNCAQQENDQDVISCFVCCAKDHVGCATWNECLRRYPAGLYLCARCCRSNRPDRQTVRQLLCNAPVRARESTFLQTCASKIFHILDRLRRSNDGTVYESGLTPLHIALSMEIHDPEVMSDLFAKFLHENSFTNREIEIWNRLATLRPGLPLCAYGYEEFSPAKRKRSRWKRSLSSVKKQKLEDEDEKGVICGASSCILPQAASKVRWVLCEGGCSRWFHYICVNLTVKTANSVQHYKCSDCIKKSEEVTAN